MTMISWRTGDYDEGIPHSEFSVIQETVYLVQPEGKKPIAEANYRGDATFDGQNAFEILVSNNFPDVEFTCRTEKQRFGMYLQHTTIYEDDCRYFVDCDLVPQGSVAMQALRGFLGDDKPIVSYKSRMAALPDLGGLTLNTLVGSGSVEMRTLKVFFPLKFSYNPRVEYHQLGPSRICSYQGYCPRRAHDLVVGL